MSQADSLFEQRKYSDAAILYDSASRTGSFDSTMTQSVMAIACCALCYSRIDKLVQADSLFTIALQQPSAWNNLDTLLMNAYFEFADLKVKLGELEAATALYSQSRLISERILEPNDSLRYSIKFSECVTLQQAGRFTEAKVLCQSLYADAVRVYGKTHEKSLLALEAYFTCMLALKEFAEVEGLSGAAIVRLADAKLESSPFLPSYGETLAFARYRQGKIPEALKAYRVALKQSKYILGAEDRVTLSLRSNYVNVLREAGYSSLADSVEHLLVPR